MSKTKYQNTVVVPGSASDEIADGLNIGGDITTNFMAIADIVHKTGDYTSAGVAVGGSGNLIPQGTNSVFVGGMNSTARIDGAVVTNHDPQNIQAGGYSFIKSITLASLYTTHDANSEILEMPAGGYAHFMIQYLNPTLGYVGMTTLEILPGSSGTLYPENYDSSIVNFRFYLNNGVLYVEHEGYEVGQIVIWGTVIGSNGSGGTDGDGDTSW